MGHSPYFYNHLWDKPVVCNFLGTFHGFLSNAVTVPGETVTFTDGSMLNMLIGYMCIINEQAFKSYAFILVFMAVLSAFCKELEAVGYLMPCSFYFMQALQGLQSPDLTD
jgi:hypothetical protein